MAFTTLPGGVSKAGRAFGPIIGYPAIRHTATVIMLHGLVRGPSHFHSIPYSSSHPDPLPSRRATPATVGPPWPPRWACPTSNGASAPALPCPRPAHPASLPPRVFPTAPTRPITVNFGSQMPGWFDIDHLDEESMAAMMRGHRGFDPEGVAESIAYVSDLVGKEVAAGTPPSRIVVGGFSQGGHVALRTALQSSARLAGCVAMSTWLEPSPFDIPPANLDLPIFYGHGAADPLIPAPIAVATQAVLEGRGATDVAFKMYPGMGHSSCPQEMADLKAFLLRVLPDAGPSAAEVAAMSARELKAFIQGRGGSTVGLLEKQDLVDAALALLEKK